MRTWLLVAAERREFDGLMKRLGSVEEAGLAGGVRAWNRSFGASVGGWWQMGLAGKQSNRLWRARVEVSGIMSTGFCGALDPALGIGDIVSSDRVRCSRGSCRGDGRRKRRVARENRGRGGRNGIGRGRRKGPGVGRTVPLRCALFPIPLRRTCRSISICIATRAGRFSPDPHRAGSRGRPFTAIPALLRLDRNCRIASEALGEFFVDCGL